MTQQSRFRQILQSSLAVALLLTQPLVALAAEGGASGVGKGGDARCEEFFQAASNLSIVLAKIGQDKVDSIDPLIRVQEIREVVKKLKVVPVEELDRDARSDRQTMTTSLKVKRWQKMNGDERYVLAMHELLVLADVESEGEYGITQDFKRIVAGSPMVLGMKSDGYVINPDGSYLIKNPRYQGRGITDRSSAAGVCKYLGFKKLVTEPESRSLGLSYQFCLKENAVLIDEQGRIESERVCSAMGISLITCGNDE